MMRNAREISGRHFCTVVFLPSKGRAKGGVDHELGAQPSVSKHGRNGRRVSTSQDAVDHDNSAQTLWIDETSLNDLPREDNNAMCASAELGPVQNLHAHG
jgi:hypothetical protein